MSSTNEGDQPNEENQSNSVVISERAVAPSPPSGYGLRKQRVQQTNNNEATPGAYSATSNRAEYSWQQRLQATANQNRNQDYNNNNTNDPSSIPPELRVVSAADPNPSLDEDILRPAETEDKKQEPQQFNKKYLLLGCGLLVTLAVIVLGVVLGTKKNDIEVRSERELFLQSKLLSIVHDENDFRNPHSPTYQAITWLANHDPLTLFDHDDTNHETNHDKDSDSEYQQQQQQQLENRFILSTLYYATGGVDWNQDYHFLSQYHECNWTMSYTTIDANEPPFEDATSDNNNDTITSNYNGTNSTSDIIVQQVEGVLCDDDVNPNLITGINLTSNNLNGNLPPELWKLPSLENIFLSNNKLSIENVETDWTEMSNLSDLQTLDLSNNQIVSTVPTEIGLLTNLNRLELGWNQFYPSISLALDIFRNLQLSGLVLDHNQLGGTIPNILPLDGSNLTALSLAGNSITGLIPDTMLSEQTNLQYLSLSSNRLFSSLPSSIGAWTSLKGLDLSTNLFYGSLQSDLQYLTDLEILRLDSNKLAGRLPAWIGKLSLLKYLDLNDNSDMKGRLPSAIRNLQNLRELNLEDTSFRGNINYLCKDPAWNDTVITVPDSTFVCDCCVSS